MKTFGEIPKRIKELPAPPKPDPFKYHFFVSYTTRENEVSELLPTIREFVDELVSAGFSVSPFFFDILNFRIQRFDQITESSLRYELENAIEESVCMISFVSPGYLESKWCNFEWKCMLQYKCKVPLIQPIIWKEINWKNAENKLNLIKPPADTGTFWPPGPVLNEEDHIARVRLVSYSDEYSYPIETYLSRFHWLLALNESYRFILSRTRIRSDFQFRPTII